VAAGVERQAPILARTKNLLAAAVADRWLRATKSLLSLSKNEKYFSQSDQSCQATSVAGAA
jgi:hypothetical protein